MDINEMIRIAVQILERADFIISRIKGVSEMSFDLAARRDDQLLLIKIIRERSMVRPAVASEMKVLASVLSASPLVLIPTSMVSKEQDGVLYITHGIPLMTLDTFREHLLEDVPPLVYYSSGGHFVTMDGSRMRDIRESMGISLGSISKSVGVSRRAVQMYESGMGVDLDTAMRIEDLLGVPLVLPLDPFSRSGDLQDIRENMSDGDSDCMEVLDHLGSLGMEVIRTTRCPFDALAKKDKDLLMTSMGTEERSMMEAGSTLSSLTRVTGNESFLVATGPLRGRSIGGTPVLTIKDVKGTDDIEDLLELIRKRRKGSID